MTHIVVIDDEERFVTALAIGLRSRGFTVQTAPDAAAGTALLASAHADLVLLDLGLPDDDGVSVLASLRRWSTVPVIVLSARHTDASKVSALDAGADDYLTKPFSIEELLARMRATLRRAAPTDAEPTVTTAAFTVDLAGKQVRAPDGSVIRLTPTEWGVVEALVRARGRLVGQRDLLQAVWGPEYGDETHYLRVYIAAVRRKLEPTPRAPRYFLTEAGRGYRFVGD